MPRSGKLDPYRKFMFRIKIDGTVVAALTKCSALKTSVESQDFRSGDQPSFKQKLPGQVSYDAITLEKGLTDSTVFQDWATVMTNFLGNQGDGLGEGPRELPQRHRDHHLRPRQHGGEVVSRAELLGLLLYSDPRPRRDFERRADREPGDAKRGHPGDRDLARRR